MKRFLIFFFFLSQVVFAQQIKFFHTFGAGIYDSGEGVVQSTDTGYVVAGITTPTTGSGTDILMYKTDSLGSLMWYKNIGLNNALEGAKSIIGSISGGGYLLAGYQNNFDTSGYNFYVVKTDLNGDTLWTKKYGGSDWDIAYSLDTLQDSTYVIAGETYSFGNGNLDMYVIRINQIGDTLWTRTFGGANDDYARYVYVDRHNNIMTIGTTNSFGAGGTDMYIIYMNEDGDTIWTKTYGTVDDEYGYSGDMYINNGNAMSFLYGFTSYYAPHDAQKMRFYRADTTSCALILDLGVLTTNIEIVDHPRIRRDGPGKFYYCSDIHNSGGLKDIFLSKTFYGLGFDLASSLLYLPDEDIPHDIRKCFDQGYVSTGETKSFGPGPTASFILKTDTFFVSPIVPLVEIEDIDQINFSIYPNPVTEGVVYVDAGFPIERLVIYDMNGRILQSTICHHNATEQIQLNPLSSGIYILEVTTTKGVGRKKIIVGN